MASKKKYTEGQRVHAIIVSLRLQLTITDHYFILST